MVNIDKARAAEHEKYVRCYAQSNYRMGRRRMIEANAVLEDLPTRGPYLDVSCGHGEMLTLARLIGYSHQNGTELVKSLTDHPRIVWAEVHDLPFVSGRFQAVTMLDVMEHLLPGDDKLACKELLRVSNKHVVIAVNNCHSTNKSGDVLHINIRPYDEWDALFREWFAPHQVTLKSKETFFSQIWRVDLIQQQGN